MRSWPRRDRPEDPGSAAVSLFGPRSDTLSSLDPYVVEAFRGATVVVGVGPPGARYAHTVEQAGVRAVDLFSKRCGAQYERVAGGIDVASAVPKGRRVLVVRALAYPEQWLDASAPFFAAMACSPADALVVRADPSVAAGEVRIDGGVATPHLRAATLGPFATLRVGVAPTALPLHEAVGLGEARAADATSVFVTRGLDAARRRFNGTA